MRFTIHNDYIKAIVDTKGAELVSAIAEDKEFIWSAEEVWPKHAPNLFPIVGALIDNSYTLKGKKYELSQHGFARDMEFDMLHQSQHSISFVLQQNEETLAMYPFPFTLIINFNIKGNKITQRFRVLNEGEEAMPVSFGAHPAFAVENINDYELVFEKDQSPEVLLLDGKQVSRLSNQLIDGNVLRLGDHTFDNDALIFQNLKSEYVCVRHLKSDHEIRLRISEFPYLGIWSKPKANFVCIEPWQGIADFSDHDGSIENKEGIVWINAGEELSQTYCMQFSS